MPLDLQHRAITDGSHLAIYEALVAGNSEKARHEMRQHLSLAYDSLLHDVQTPPSVRRPDNRSVSHEFATKQRLENNFPWDGSPEPSSSSPISKNNEVIFASPRRIV